MKMFVASVSLLVSFLFLGVAGVRALQGVPAGGNAVSSGASARWQRVLMPPAATPMAAQCAVVDADLYAHAAPGLRDVRLMQDGQELPYAMDVSFDTRVGDAAPPPADDRALYEPVQTIPLRPQPGDGHDTYSNETLLSAHVPVERVRIVPVPKTEETVELRASARMELGQAEELRTTLTPAQPAVPFTIGANLQEPADVLVRVVTPGGAPQAMVLEMRRREICYQPRSMSPVHLLVGDATALPPAYDYALHFQPTAHPLMAAMGPMTANPAYVTPTATTPMLRSTGSLRWTVMLVIVLGSLAVTAFAVVELRRK